MTRRAMVATWVLKLAIGALLVIAGALKLQDPSAFAEEITNYRLFPQFAAAGAALLPGLEVVAGLVLIGARPRSLWLPAAAVVALGLFAVFAAALSYVVTAGIDVNCGCFGSGSSPASWWLVARSVALMIGCAALVWLSRPPDSTT